MIKVFKKPQGSSKVRAPSLCVGVTYQICIWDRRKTNSTPISAKFLGWGIDKDHLSNDIPKLNSIDVNSEYRLFFDNNGEEIKLQIINNLVMIPYSIEYKKNTRHGMKRVTFYYDESVNQYNEHHSKMERNKQKNRENKIKKYGTSISSELSDFISNNCDNPEDLFNVDLRSKISKNFPKSYIEDTQMGSGIVDKDKISGVLQELDYMMSDCFGLMYNPSHNKRSSYLNHRYDDLKNKINQLSRKDKIILDLIYEDNIHYKKFINKKTYDEIDQDVSIMNENNIHIVDNSNTLMDLPKTLKMYIFFHYVNRVEGAMTQFKEIWNLDEIDSNGRDSNGNVRNIKIVMSKSGKETVEAMKENMSVIFV